MSEIVPSLTSPSQIPVYYAMETMKELEYDEDEADHPLDEAWEMHYTEGKRRCMSIQVRGSFFSVQAWMGTSDTKSQVDGVTPLRENYLDFVH